MLQTIRIQNFRSLEDVTLTLQEVNLLIGPNNSGKSNLFKALEFLKLIFSENLQREKDLKKFFFMKRMNENGLFGYPPITITVLSQRDLYRVEIYGINPFGKIISNELIGIINHKYNGDLYEDLNLNNIPKLNNIFNNFERPNNDPGKNS